MTHVTRPPPESKWLSVTKYANVYGVDRSTVYKWLSAHLLETYKQGSILRIKNAPVDQHHPRAERL